MFFGLERAFFDFAELSEQIWKKNSDGYEPMQIEVEKVITLYGKRFEQLKTHPLDDVPEIMDNKELMYMEGNTAHCVLLLDYNGNDGILVESEGADYARKSQFIPNARAIVEQNDMTPAEPVL